MEAKVKPETARRKAELLAGGSVSLPKHFRLPFSPSRSTAGPGAGNPEIVFSFEGTRAKKAVSRKTAVFELVEASGGLGLSRRGETFIDSVELVPTLHHAPFQAFINVDSRCVYSCAFCSMQGLGRDMSKHLTDEKILDMVRDASKNEDFRGVALTSGVSSSPSETADRIAGLVRRIRSDLPESPIGVEPYVTRPDQIDAIMEAGASEIKINIESFDRDIFEKACPGRDYDVILHGINHACKVFGRNRVCSNILFGLGESDETVLQGCRALANMGAVATLRALRVNEYNTPALTERFGALKPVTAERMLRLASEHKRILQSHGLTTLSFETMCNACLACDIVPFWDV
jgi:biotin synthase-related radical SAM superfamily protein